MTELLPTPLGRILRIFTRRDTPAPPAIAEWDVAMPKAKLDQVHLYDPPAQSAIDLKVAPAPIHGHRFGLATTTTPTKAPMDEIDESGTPSEPIPPNPFAGGFYDLLLPPVADLVEREFRLPFQLYPYQVAGVEFLSKTPRALLADQMGLGKTIEAIVALRVLMRWGSVKRLLVICPASLRLNWKMELDRWAPDLYVRVIERRTDYQLPGHVCIANYERFSRREPSQNDADSARRADFDLVILDEAQRIKNPEAIMSKAIKTLKSPYRWALSGTPLENRTDDLRSILDFLDLQPGGHRPGLAAPAELKKQLTSCMLRRKKADVLKELPPKRFQERWLELSKDQRTAYDLARAEGIVRIMAGLAGATGAQELQQVMIEHVFALITRLKQICNRDPLTGASAKFDVLAEELEEIAAEGSKALVFSQYRESIIQIQHDLTDRGIRAEVYHGNLTTQQRESALTAFRKTEEIPVLLMTTKAGGLGLNLQEASYVYHFDQMWNPAANAQAEDRAHRIGQDKSLLVTSLLARDTIDERIMEILNEKRALFAEFVDSTAAEPTQEKAATLALRALGLDPGLMGKEMQ